MTFTSRPLIASDWPQVKQIYQLGILEVDEMLARARFEPNNLVIAMDMRS